MCAKELATEGLGGESIKWFDVLLSFVIQLF